MYHVVEGNGYGIGAGAVGHSFEDYEEAINKALEYAEKDKDDPTAFVYLWENDRPDSNGDIPPRDEDTTILLKMKDGYYYFDTDYFYEMKSLLRKNK